jgi:hypothetical protein
MMELGQYGRMAGSTGGISIKTTNGMLASGALTGHELLLQVPNDIELKWLIFSVSSMSLRENATA